MEPRWVQGDLTRLEQVVSNLLSNAVKFTPPGGEIVVTLGNDASHARLTVRDTGSGMPPALLPRVFDLFVQGDASLDRSKSGLGIGLALVRQLVDLHHGTVSAFSRGPGLGSEFTVSLPLLRDDVPVTSTRDSGASAVRRIRVLVVDDQRDVADSVTMLIEALGHTATAVYDGATALAAMRHDPPDATFVDIGMPGMTGYEFAEHVRSDPAIRDQQLVALTGYGRDEDRTRVARAGFNLHLTKPVTDSELGAILAKIAHATPPA
jgi:CheY-like chemotaxis protein